MRQTKRSIATLVLGAALSVPLLASVTGCAADGAKMAAESRAKVIIQVSDGDPKVWNLALNNAQNVQHDLGKDKVDVEIVAYGPGIGMLKATGPVEPRITGALTNGVKVIACENTMKKAKLTKADMVPGIGYVPAGVIEIMEKQREGWAYVRP
jgi:intracellular sulfur oxidation DsrE/DsrF family protein